MILFNLYLEKMDLDGIVSTDEKNNLSKLRIESSIVDWLQTLSDKLYEFLPSKYNNHLNTNY